MKAKLSHVGVCVSDLEKSINFYCSALNGKVLQTIDMAASLPPVHRALLEVGSDIDASSTFIQLSGVIVELLHYKKQARDGSSRGHVGANERRPMNQLGITHLSFKTTDRDEYQQILANISKAGGKVLDSTLMKFGMDPRFEMDIIFCLDPDGTRIEIYYAPESHRIGGSGQ